MSGHWHAAPTSSASDGRCCAQRALRGAKAAVASSLRGLLPAALAFPRAGPLESGVGLGLESETRVRPPPDTSMSARRPGTPPRASSACSGRCPTPCPNPALNSAHRTCRGAGAGRGTPEQGMCAAGSQGHGGVAAGGAGVMLGALGGRQGDAAPLLSGTGTAGHRRGAPAKGRIALVRPTKSRTKSIDHESLLALLCCPGPVRRLARCARACGISMMGLNCVKCWALLPVLNSHRVPAKARSAQQQSDCQPTRAGVPATGGCITAAHAAWEAEAVMLYPAPDASGAC